MSFKTFYLVLLFLPLLWTSCQKEEELPNFDQVEILQPLVEELILPVHEDFVQQSQDLYTQAQTFTSAPDSLKLQYLREAWFTATHSWKSVELYAIGESKQSFIHTRIGKWPINPPAIIEILESNDSLNAAYVDSKGSPAQGLFALEWLLYPDSTESTLSKFTQDSLAPRRRQLLLAYCQNLILRGEALQLLWAPEGGDYGRSFLSSQFSGFKGPISLLVNGQIQLLEDVSKLKIGVPMGKFDLSGSPQVEKAEAFRSHRSLPFIRANLNALRLSFSGTEGDAILFQGLSALEAQSGGNSLALRISQQWDKIFEQLDRVNDPIESGFAQQSPEIDDLYDALKEMLTLYRSDLASALSVTVTVSDNDGD